MIRYVENGQLSRVVADEAPARLSLAGNPSDLQDQAGIRGGFVLSMPMWSRVASVALMPSTSSKLITPPMESFPNFAAQISALKDQGIGGWEHLIDNTILTFGKMMETVGEEVLAVPFSIHIDTNIPRQRGMSGSSGAIIALLNALIKMHEVERLFPLESVASWALEVEKTLGVDAGLQDRILQTYCSHDRKIGAMAMDFSKQAYKKNDGKHGEFTPLRLGDKKMFKVALVLSQKPSHSGAVHKDVKRRLAAKDKPLLAQFARLTEIGVNAREAFELGDWPTLGQLMTENAEMRVEIYGKRKLGKENMALLDACKRAECPCNFTGSGGAVVAMLPFGDRSYDRLKAEIEACKLGFEIYPIN